MSDWRCGTCYRGPTRDDLFDGGWTLGDDGDVYCPCCSASVSRLAVGRFASDQSAEGSSFVLDLSRSPAAVVVGCRSDSQAERIATFLNDEFKRED